MKTKPVISILLLILSTNAFAQDSWHNGFSKAVSGTVWVESNFRMQPDIALLTRCLADSEPIEWQTDQATPDVNDDKVTFIWLGGYSSGDTSNAHNFSLLVNDKLLFDFETGTVKTDGNWTLTNGENNLEFKFYKRNQYGDGNRDIWGYFLLTVPKSELTANNNLILKIKGDESGSRNWYMTIQQQLLPKIKIAQEKLEKKGNDGKLYHSVKITIDHYTLPQPVKISSEGEEIISDQLKLGSNIFYTKYKAVDSPSDKEIGIDINGTVTKHQVKVSPVRKISFYIIPHAHVDIGYTAIQTECEKRHWQNIDDGIKLSMKSAEYPKEAVFKWSVECLWAVKSYLENFPEKRDQFIDAVKKGWINLDANYANLMTGLSRPEELYEMVDYSNQLEKETGVKIESAMMSDIPGYTWGIVQAYADNGIKYFSSGPNPFDRIGHTLKEWGDKPFYWESPSGENKILTWLAGKSYAWFHGWRLTDGDASPLLKYFEDLDAAGYPYDMVHLRYNIGGDNGFPDSLLSDFVKNWNEKHETPKLVISSSMEMFKAFEDKYADNIPVYSGDFTPYWEDGAASTASETALSRNTAELLTQLEILYTITGKPFPQKEFDEAWRHVLLYSEHTWGAWNSISHPETKFVTDQWDVKRSYILTADSLAKKLYADFVVPQKEIKRFTVYNSTSWNRTDVVSLPASLKTGNNFVTDENGDKVAVQQLSTGELLLIAKDVPAFGSRTFTFSSDASEGLSIQASDKNVQNLSNDFYDISFDEKTGTFNLTGKNNPLSHTNLNGYIHTGRNAVNPASNGPVKITQKENGPVVNSILIESPAPGCDKLTRELRIYNELEKIDIINVIDKNKNYEKENLRFVFPFNVENPETRIDLAWAVIQPEKDQLKGANKNYFTVQRWVDVSNSDNGITLATIDAPLIEFGGMTAEAWETGGSIQKWAETASSSSLVYSWVMNNSWHTNFKASQEGTTVFKYSLLPHNKFDYLKSYRFGTEQSQPLIVSFAENNSEVLFKLDEQSKIVLTSLKPSKDGKSVIARFYNPTNEQSSTALNWTGKNHKAYISNGDEESVSDMESKIELKPFEVKTIKIEI